MRALIAVVSGALFGVGLVVSDMIDPARVLAFVDIASGAWDPTLAFVMGGAMMPMLVAWRVSAKMSEPLAGGAFPGPVTGGPDRRFLTGAVLFGAGWGLVGLCPGPAFAAVLLGGWPVRLFIAASLIGMGIHRVALTGPVAKPV